MSYGLLGLNQQFKNEALDGFSQVAQMEQQRNQANDNIKAATHSRNMNSAGAGAGIGFMAGGPVGAAIGGVGGYLVSSIFG